MRGAFPETGTCLSPSSVHNNDHLSYLAPNILHFIRSEHRSSIDPPSTGGADLHRAETGCYHNEAFIPGFLSFFLSFLISFLSLEFFLDFLSTYQFPNPLRAEEPHLGLSTTTKASSAHQLHDFIILIGHCTDFYDPKRTQGSFDS